MKLYGKAQATANTILQAFQSPETLPKAIAPIFIRRNEDTPCRKWSWNNQLGGAYRYIESYARAAEKTPQAACLECLDRICKAVALVLDTAEAIPAGKAVA